MTHYLQTKTLFPPLIKTVPSDRLGLVVVIPAYDELKLTDALDSLAQCELATVDTEVLVIVNGSESDSKEVRAGNRATFKQAREWIDKNENLPGKQFHALYFPDLPARHAGVGLARKIGMDEACRRLERVGNPEGVITGFDADSRCDSNYLIAIVEHYRCFPEVQASSIYYEHPLEGEAFDETIYQAITEYELHLRYYVHAQHYAGFPYAYQTVGSSMAVRCDAYQRQGGMNKRKAGEDFYFLHKFTPLGHFSEITNTRVIPSPRPSHRVPFGTGKAVQLLLDANIPYHSYSPESFEELKRFFQSVSKASAIPDTNWKELIASLPAAIRNYLEANGGASRLAQIRRHTASPKTFLQRFFRWFDAFRIMKFLHYARDHSYPDVPVGQAARWLLGADEFLREHKKVLSEEFPKGDAAKNLLETFRRIDRG